MPRDSQLSFCLQSPLYKGPSPWTGRPGRVVRNMRRRKRRRKRLKLKAFGQSTSTVGEENVNRYRFEFGFSSGDVQTTLLHDIETGSIEQVSLAVLVKRIRFRGETPLWSHLTLRCLNPLHKILGTCRKSENLYSGPNASEAILVSAAHCNYVCKVFLISLPGQIPSSAG